MRTLHLCPYGFKSSDPVVVGSEVDGGTALSGLSDTIYTDGGGAWQWTLSNATFGGRGDDKRAKSLSWRASNAALSGGTPAVFLFCDRYHQPVNAAVRVPHSDGTPFDDGSEYLNGGADAEVVTVVNGQDAGLNATILDIRLTSERPLIGGERFTYIGADGWLDRCAEISSITDNGDGTLRIQFQPPVRGGIAAGDALDFTNPRCVMKRVSAPSNAFDPFGLTTNVSQYVLAEYMVDPNP